MAPALSCHHRAGVAPSDLLGTRTMNRRHFFFVGAAAATLKSLSLASSGEAQTLHQDGPEWFTNVEVKAHDGRTFRFFDDLLKDKIILVNFFYTGCDALCPL